nr:hypothetical protein BaRGS_026577 [Batillaria attramentaria]
MQRNAGRVRPDGTHAGDWALRVDRPHRGANYAHININPRITGRPDLHTRIPEFAPGAAQKGARVLKGANKVMVPVAVAMDGYQTYQSVRADQKHGTTRNTVETVSSIAGGWGGGIAGAEAGAALLSLACPVIGTIVGGVGGGIAGVNSTHSSYFL